MRDSPNLDLAVRRSGGRVVVVVTGELDPSTSASLQYHFQDLIQAQSNPFVDPGVSRVRFIDRNELGVLVRNDRLLSQWRGAFTLVGVPDTLRRALEVSGLVDVHNISASQDDDNWAT